MKQSAFSNQLTSFVIRHRAACKDDSFRGPWEATVEAAKADAAKHRSQPGNRDHVIQIITEQTLSMIYQD